MLAGNAAKPQAIYQSLTSSLFRYGTMICVLQNSNEFTGFLAPGGKPRTTKDGRTSPVVRAYDALSVLSDDRTSITDDRSSQDDQA